METEFRAARPGATLGARWARQRVAALEHARLGGTSPSVVRADVIDLAKRFGIVTPYTSFVVVADEWHLVEGVRGGDSREGDLPQGGTDDPLLFALGALGTAAGAAILLATTRFGKTAP